jgi:acyl-CoA thioester hydrolase
MTRAFTRRFKVREYELDSFGHVNHAVYIKYLQEAAIEASADAGYDMDWYKAAGTQWVIRKLTARYHTPALYGDELEVTTWVSDLRRVRSQREYDVRRVSDGQRVLRARHDWVYMDMSTDRPRRVPENAVENFDPSGDQPDLRVRLHKPDVVEDCHRYRSTRKVQTYELNTAQHVSHANYLPWVEQAYFDAARSAGYSISRMLDEGWMVLQAGHEMEYFNSAQEGDSIEIVSWVAEMARVRGAWIHEIYNAESGQLLARDYSLGVFLDRNLKPRSFPEWVLDDIVAGPERVAE